MDEDCSITTQAQASAHELRHVERIEQNTESSIQSQLHSDEVTNGILSSDLPPCDRGYIAWRTLWAMYVFEALLWGFPLSFGVFQEYYSGLPQLRESRLIALIGTTASGIIYVGAPIMIPLTRRYARYRRQMIWLGWPICILSLVASSFARSLPALVVTQGLLYGTGFIIFYYPILSMVNEFWITRRGFAYGILCGASGVSGAAIPFAVNALLQRYGYQITLRAIAVGLFVLTGPFIPFLKGRLPDEALPTSTRTDWSFLRVPRFWIYSFSNIAMGLGYFLPSLYLPTYVTALGASPTIGALILAIMSISQVLGQATFGYLSDRKLPLNALLLLSTTIAGVSSYLLWGLARSIPLLIVFSMIYGFFGAGYTAMWARMGTSISSEPSAAFASFGLFNLGKGLGNVLAGTISGALLLRDVNAHKYGVMKYAAVILFTGTCMMISAAIIPLSYVKGTAFVSRTRSLTT